MLARCHTTVLAFYFLLSFGFLCAQDVGDVPDFRNPELAPEQRAADLVNRMTLQEKVLQMQNAAPAIPRLGIPAYDWWNEALHGVARAGRATVFPQAIGLAATWDTTLIKRVADTISTEARAKYNKAIREDNHRRYFGLTFWSPNINIFRDPRWGRGQETYGEDPFLTSRMAVAFIQGMQGDDPLYLKTVATAKHFAVHSGPEPARHQFDAHPSAQDLEQTYMPAFKASIMDGRADSVMCAYNRVDGVPACGSTFLLQEHLRDSWNFHGYVVSDCGAITDIAEGHKYKPSLAEASAVAVKAGTDLTCGNEYGSLVDAVQQGLISQDQIDVALRRLFTARFRLGMFDPPERVPYAHASDNDTPEHQQLALQAARKSIVLLENHNGALPLSEHIRSIAVVGPAADDPDTLLGNYHGVPSQLVTPLDGIRNRFGSRVRITFAQGSTFTSVSNALVPDDVLIPRAEEQGLQQSPQHGLLAEYFDNPDLTGRAVFSRIERRVYLQREMEDPAVESRMPRDGYSVRWDGSLRAPYSGEYKIGVVRVRCSECSADHAARLFLNDKPVLETTSQDSATKDVSNASVHLRKGQRYRLRLEYSQRHGGVGVQLVWIPPALGLVGEAVKAAKHSTVTVAFVGLNSDLEGEESGLNIPGFIGGDRTTLDLPAPQVQLLDALRQTGKPLIVVLLSGSAVTLGSVQDHVSALLESWYGGEEAGSAIAETLAGENNPGGRLPVTFYRSVADLPAFDDYAMGGRTYRYFAGTPWFPFGYGLSYSSFRYSNLQIVPTREDKTRLHISASVENVSAREGDEVVQLYVNKQASLATDTIRELRGFERIHLEPGQSRTVEFDLDTSATRTGSISEGGKLKISLGGGQPVGDTPRVEGVF